MTATITSGTDIILLLQRSTTWLLGQYLKDWGLKKRHYKMWKMIITPVCSFKSWSHVICKNSVDECVLLLWRTNTWGYHESTVNHNYLVQASNIALIMHFHSITEHHKSKGYVPQTSWYYQFMTEPMNAIQAGLLTLRSPVKMWHFSKLSPLEFCTLIFCTLKTLMQISAYKCVVRCLLNSRMASPNRIKISCVFTASE